MTAQFVNIHTHRPTGRGIELRTAGIHPWDADKEDIARTRHAARRTCRPSARRGSTIARGAGRAAATGRASAPSCALARDRQLPVVLHCVRAFEPRHAANWPPAEPRAVDLPRVHRLARAGTSRTWRKATTSRSACATFASPKTHGGPARNTPRAALSRNRRQRRRHRGGLRASRGRRHAGGRTGDAENYGRIFAGLKRRTSDRNTTFTNGYYAHLQNG